MTGFDPSRSRLLVAPPDDGPGSWAGAPGACRDGTDLFLCYRLRRPPPERGYELRVASVGERVSDLWRVGKIDLAAESIERAALVRAGGTWRLYLSYVSREDRQWRIGVLESAAIDAFDARAIRTVLQPRDVGMSALKDPWLRLYDGRWLMFISCGRVIADPLLHARGDALSTGLVKSETGVATSADGLSWTWRGIALAASDDGWDRFTARLTCAVPDGEGWVGYYDGSASLAENYEERCGLARSGDLLTWQRVGDAPAIGTARGPGGVRYVDMTEAGDVFFEFTRSDGAHELRGISADR